MFKAVPVAVSLVCLAVTACADLRSHAGLDPSAALPVSVPGPEGDPEFLAEQASFYAEYAPWRTGHARASSTLRLPEGAARLLQGAAERKALGSGPQPEPPPENLDDLAGWLERRREWAAQVPAAHTALLDEIDAEAKKAVRSVCVGC